MFIDDSHSLHECVTNSGSDETEAASLEILAHRIALGTRWGNPAEVQRTTAQHPAAAKLPNVVVERTQGRTDLKVCFGVGNERFDFESISDDPGIAQQPPAF